METLDSFLKERKKAIVKDAIEGMEYRDIAVKYGMSIRNVHYHLAGKLTILQKTQAAKIRLAQRKLKDEN